jgi:hypothetical protein
VSNQFEWIRSQVCELSSEPPDYFDCNAPTPPPAQDIEITIAIQFDDFPMEISWLLKDDTFYGQTASEMPPDSYADQEQQASVFHSVTVKERSTYSFIITDKGGDGLCCYTPGTYTVYIGNPECQSDILATGSGNFGPQAVNQFTMPNIAFISECKAVTSAPTASPTTSPAPTFVGQTLTPTVGVAVPTATPTTNETESSSPTATPTSIPTSTPIPTPRPTRPPTLRPTDTPTISPEPTFAPTALDTGMSKNDRNSIIYGVLIVLIAIGIFGATSWYADNHNRMNKSLESPPLMTAQSEDGSII